MPQHIARSHTHDYRRCKIMCWQDVPRSRHLAPLIRPLNHSPCSRYLAPLIYNGGSRDHPRSLGVGDPSDRCGRNGACAAPGSVDGGTEPNRKSEYGVWDSENRTRQDRSGVWGSARGEERTNRKRNGTRMSVCIVIHQTKAHEYSDTHSHGGEV